MKTKKGKYISPSDGGDGVRATSTRRRSRNDVENTTYDACDVTWKRRSHPTSRYSDVESVGGDPCPFYEATDGDPRIGVSSSPIFSSVARRNGKAVETAVEPVKPTR